MTDLLRELLANRGLLGMLVLRNLRLRYRGAGLGYLWSLANPLLLLLTYSVVFSSILRVDIPDFPLYLGCGILPWVWFTHSVTAGIHSVEQSAGLLRRAYFPAQILPVVDVTASFAHFLVSLPILVLLLTLAGRPPGLELLGLLPLFAVQFTLLAGLGLLLAAVGTRFQDVEYVVSNLMLVLFFLSAIVYLPEHVPPDLRFLLWINPVAVLVDGYHATLFYETWPAWPRLGVAAVIAVSALVLGSAIFGRMRWHFVERL